MAEHDDEWPKLDGRTEETAVAEQLETRALSRAPGTEQRGRQLKLAPRRPFPTLSKDTKTGTFDDREAQSS